MSASQRAKVSTRPKQIVPHSHNNNKKAATNSNSSSRIPRQINTEKKNQRISCRKIPFDKRRYRVTLNFKDLRTTVISVCTAKLANRSTTKKKKSDRLKFSISCDAKGEHESSAGRAEEVRKKAKTTGELLS